MNWVYSIIFAVICGVIVVALHELGHWIILRSYGIKAKFKFFWIKGPAIGFEVPLENNVNDIIITVKTALNGFTLPSIFIIVVFGVLEINPLWELLVLLVLAWYSLWEVGFVLGFFQLESDDKEVIPETIKNSDLQLRMARLLEKEQDSWKKEG